MINELRTLLMNIEPSEGLQASYAGDEFIVPNFRPLKLPSYLARIRDRLFGVAPDRLFLNYRVKQLLALIEATDLRNYVKYYDPRITYDIYSNDFFDDALFGAVPRGSLVDFMFISGDAASPDSLGTSHHQLQLILQPGSLTINRLGKFPKTYNYPVTFNLAGISEMIPLPGTGYSVRFSQFKGTDAVGVVDVYLRPKETCSEVYNKLTALPAETYVQLFGPAPVEPFLTFKNCWDSHPELAYRLSGLVLAYGFRLSELLEVSPVLVPPVTPDDEDEPPVEELLISDIIEDLIQPSNIPFTPLFTIDSVEA